jgi:hypothetical protein
MKLFDTRSGDTRELIAGHTIRLYVCGITPYDATHLGHAFTYVMFDVLIRTLEHQGHRVRHVRNVTDVDDDMLRTARERGVDYLQLAATETARFDQDMLALGCRPADVAPRATESVDAIITAVRGLLRPTSSTTAGSTSTWRGRRRSVSCPGSAATRCCASSPTRVVIRKPRANAILWTFCCGNPGRQASRPGRAHGARGGLVGTSSAR